MVVHEKLNKTPFEDVYDDIQRRFPNFFKTPSPDYKKMVKRIESSNEGPDELNTFWGGLKFLTTQHMKDKAEYAYKLPVEDFMYLCGFDKLSGPAREWIDQTPEMYEAKDDEKYIKQFTDAITSNYGTEDVIDAIKNSRMEKYLEAIHAYNDAGRKNFKVEEALVEELLLTDVNRVDDFFLNLPYKACLVELPRTEGLTMRLEPIQWVFLAQEDSLTEKKIKVVMLTYKQKLKLEHIIEEGDISKVHQHIKQMEFYYAESFEFTFRGGDIIKQVTEQVAENVRSRIAKDEATNMFTFIVGLLLYMKADPEDIVVTFPRKIFKTDSKHSTQKVGGKITIRKKGYRTKPDNETDVQKKERQAHITKWTVRGHFRTYRKGNFYKQDKVIWIQPFLKGWSKDDENVDTMGHDYEVKK